MGSDEPIGERADAERLRRWNRGFNPIVFIAAILGLAPIAVGDDPTVGPGAAVALSAWSVFALDFGVRWRLHHRFLHTWKGRTYLAIVVITFPIYLLIPRLEETDLLALCRLGWISILAISGFESVRDARLLIRRLGVAGVSVATAVVMASLLIRRAEAADDGFDTLGESLWWSIVTVTTVGYGDRVPTTGSGRVIAAVLMLCGLAILGVVAATLAAHFGLDDETPGGPAGDDEHHLLLDEIRALRAEVEHLAAAVAGTSEASDRTTSTGPVDADDHGELAPANGD